MRTFHKFLEEQQNPPQGQGQQNQLLRTIIQTIHKQFNLSQQELTNFSTQIQPALQSLPKQQYDAVSQSPQGLQVLLTKMAELFTQSTGIDLNSRRRNQQGQQNQGRSPSEQKLIGLAQQLGQKMGKDPKFYMDLVADMMRRNGQQRTDKWAQEITTSDQLLAKFNDWKQRGLLKAQQN